MVRNVLTYPNKKLKLKSKKVDRFDESLFTLLDDMYETMLHYGGIGLAAIQIGIALDVIIIELRDEDDNVLLPKVEIMNPVLKSKSGETKYKEGCLSVPDFYEEITRSSEVVLEYQDRNGDLFTIDADGLLAIAIQHEMDHLDGKLFFERLSILKRKKFDKEYLPPKKQKADKAKIRDA
jgi:peptide deformylase